MFLAVEPLIRLIEEKREDAFCSVCTNFTCHDLNRLSCLSSMNTFLSEGHSHRHLTFFKQGTRCSTVHGLFVASSCHASGETGDQEDVCNNLLATDNCKCNVKKIQLM